MKNKNRRNEMKTTKTEVVLKDRLPISDVFQAPAYRRVNSEEGAYDVCCGSNVLAFGVPDEDGVRIHYLYTGRDPVLPVLFEQEAFADETVEAIRNHGSINPKYWLDVNSDNIFALPDYVTNPHRPEYHILEDDEHAIQLFVRNMGEFDAAFCKKIAR
jgi:hypothetical protein